MMKKEKLVSIILPVYNGEDNIGSAIESVLNQSYKNWELIIVNDCSTDNTLEILLEFQKRDPRVHVICNERNLKLPKTLNVGFKHARGEYYTWTSDDNLYKKNAIETMVGVLEENSDISMVYSDYSNIDSSGTVLNYVNLQEPEALVVGNVIGACFLYTAKVAQLTNGYDADLFLAEDYDYWIQIYKNGKIKHICEDLYSYRLHVASLTATRKDEINFQTYKVLEKNFFFLYSCAKKHKKVFAFFDQMVQRQNESKREELISDLKIINGKYKFYLIKKQIRLRIVTFGKKLLRRK